LTARQYHGEGILDFHVLTIANLSSFFKAYQDADELQLLVNSTQATKLLIKQILHPLSQKDHLGARRPNALDKDQGIMELYINS
jgi:hypothetical protein